MKRAFINPEPTDPIAQDPLPPFLSFPNPDPLAWPKWSNFGYFGTNGMIEASMPPYNLSGQPIRKVSYRDRLYYEAYHNYADLDSPVFYAYDRRNNGALGGQSQGDWFIQTARESLESILFSRPRLNGHIANLSSEAITPWVAGINQYFVNADVHRKLLALMRAKEAGEFHVFIDRNAAMPARTMRNWTAYRHLIDQVWGFDIDEALSNLASNPIIVTDPDSPGTPPTPDAGELAFGDFNFWRVASVADPIQQPYPGAQRVEIRPVFGVFPAFATTPPDPSFDPLAVANSANLRVNVEFVVLETGSPPTGTGDPSSFVTPYVLIYRPGKGWTPVTMTTVCAVATCASDGVHPGIGHRYVMTGTISNAAPRFVDLHAPSSQSSLPNSIGTVGVAVGLESNVTTTTRFDLVQLVGVDANESDLDWDHNGVVNGADLMAFVDDFVALWTSPGATHPIYSTVGLLALDSDNSGYVAIPDLCNFYDRLQAIGALTPADCSAFNTRIHSLGFMCTPEHACNYGGN